MSITSKAACVIVFLTSILLIFTMGRTNQRHFAELHNSIEEIYKDRLVVKGMIYDMASILHKKEIGLLSTPKIFFEVNNPALRNEMDELLVEYRKTYLTDREETTLMNFEKGVKDLRKVEDAIIYNNNDSISMEFASKYSLLLDSLATDLRSLSRIQLSEGKRKLNVGDRAIEMMNTNQQFENYAIALIGFLILVVILWPKSKSTPLV